MLLASLLSITCVAAISMAYPLRVPAVAARRPKEGMTDLTELAAAIDGDVIVPGDPRYGTARLAWNSRFDDARPAAVIRVANAGDVAVVVDFARDGGRTPVARSGGHSFAGYSTGDGLVIDLGSLTAVAVDGEGGRARLGSGSTMLATYRALSPHRLAICGGTCPTVGIAGLTAGGGLGVLSRKHGLTCDTLAEAEVVTADGAVVRADEAEHADLLWALRGGGGGNFGVVTELTFDLVPVDGDYTELSYTLPWSTAVEAVDAWQRWLPDSPAEMWSAIELETAPPGPEASPVVLLEVVHGGSQGQAEAAIADMLDAVGAKPLQMSAHCGPFVDVEHDLLCKGLRVKECVLADKFASGRVPRPALYAKSDVAGEPWSRDGLETLVEWVERRQRDPVMTPPDFSTPHTVGKVLIEAADGAVNSVASDATAFVHRDNLFVAQFQARWHETSHASIAEANVAWTDGLYAAVSEHRSGFAYQNYIDAGLEEWERAYYGANLERLRAVKARYDPANLFSFAQSVPPAGDDSGFVV